MSLNDQLAKITALRDAAEFYGDGGEPEVPQRRPRSDAFPEGLDYIDRGCRMAPSCLSCPFPHCLYEKGNITPRHAYRPLQALFLELRAQGLTIEAAALAAGVSKRTAHRYLLAAKSFARSA